MGNHSYHHLIDSRGSMKNVRNDLKLCQDLITDITGQPPVYYRPPGGRLRLDTLLIPPTIGLQTVSWSASASDYSCPSQEQALAMAGEMTKTIKNGDIILLHDSNPHVLTILDLLLPWLVERGFATNNVEALKQ